MDILCNAAPTFSPIPRREALRAHSIARRESVLPLGSPNCSPMAVRAKSKDCVVPAADATDSVRSNSFEKLTADVDRLLQNETGFMALVSPLLKTESCL
jgi:hypothetical protein